MKLNSFKFLSLRMIFSKAFMSDRMPILSCYHKIKFLLKIIDDRNNFISSGNREGSPGNKIILHIYNYKCLHLIFYISSTSLDAPSSAFYLFPLYIYEDYRSVYI